MMTKTAAAAKQETLSNDPRLKLILAAIKKENAKADSLIQILHMAQNIFGYLPMNVIAFITKELHLPPSRVYGVVTFYHFFSLKPKGEHTCLVCTGTACYVKGAEQILKELEKEFGLKAGEVTADNKLGVQIARCLGSCGLAPAVVVDETIMARVKPEEVKKVIRSKIGGAA